MAVTYIRHANANGSSEPLVAPYFIPATETFTVPANKQLTFSVTINIEGYLDVEGIIVEVQ